MAQLVELSRVLDYPRLSGRISPEQKHDLLTNVGALAAFAEDLPVLDVSTDPTDNVILATAVAGGAHLVVSDDSVGMLALAEVRGIPIVSVRKRCSASASRIREGSARKVLSHHVARTIVTACPFLR